MFGIRQLKLRITHLECDIAIIKAQGILKDMGINMVIPPPSVRDNGERVFPIHASYLDIQGKIKNIEISKTGEVFERM